MSMRDKIEETITFYLAERDFYGVCWVEDAADAIITALPDYDAQQARIAELEAALIGVLPYVSTSREDAECACMERFDRPIGNAVSITRAALKGGTK
jgi:hypothetical protein